MLKLFETDFVLVNVDGVRIEKGIVYAQETIDNGEIELLDGEKLVSCTDLPRDEQLILIAELD